MTGDRSSSGVTTLNCSHTGPGTPLCTGPTLSSRGRIGPSSTGTNSAENGHRNLVQEHVEPFGRCENCGALMGWLLAMIAGMVSTSGGPVATLGHRGHRAVTVVRSTPVEATVPPLVELSGPPLSRTELRTCASWSSASRAASIARTSSEAVPASVSLLTSKEFLGAGALSVCLAACTSEPEARPALSRPRSQPPCRCRA